MNHNVKHFQWKWRVISLYIFLMCQCIIMCWMCVCLFQTVGDIYKEHKRILVLLLWEPGNKWRPRWDSRFRLRLHIDYCCEWLASHFRYSDIPQSDVIQGRRKWISAVISEVPLSKHRTVLVNQTRQTKLKGTVLLFTALATTQVNRGQQQTRDKLQESW